MTISFPKETTSGMNLYLIHKMTLYNHVILDNKLNLCPKDEAPLVQVQNLFFYRGCLSLYKSHKLQRIGEN